MARQCLHGNCECARFLREFFCSYFHLFDCVGLCEAHTDFGIVVCTGAIGFYRCPLYALCLRKFILIYDDGDDDECSPTCNVSSYCGVACT